MKKKRKEKKRLRDKFLNDQLPGRLDSVRGEAERRGQGQERCDLKQKSC